MDSRHATRRDPIRDRSHGDEKGGGSDEDARVGSSHAVEHRGEDTGPGGSHRRAECDSHEDQADA